MTNLALTTFQFQYIDRTKATDSMHSISGAQGHPYTILTVTARAVEVIISRHQVLAPSIKLRSATIPAQNDVSLDAAESMFASFSGSSDVDTCPWHELEMLASQKVLFRCKSLIGLGSAAP